MGTKIDRNIKIIGTGRYIPKRKVESEELDKIMGLSKGACYNSTKVQTRYWIEDETCSQMGGYASQQALDKAGMKPSDLDVIVSTCGVNEQPIPTGACLLSEKLGLNKTHIPGFDVNSSCMSFLQGLDVVSYMINHGRYNNALICSSDITSGGINYGDIKSCPLFGDGASAMIITKDNTNMSGIITSNSETYSKGSHFSEIRGGGNKLHPITYNSKNHNDFIYELHGTEMAKLVFKEADGFLNRTFDKINMDFKEVVDDVSVVIPHQVSPAFVKLLGRRLNLGDKLLDLTPSFGNMLSVSVPLGIDEAISSNRIKRGDRFLIFGGGSGISLGTMYLQY
jgi:3-oxoacyl-[acyl-carrier-protein] synthase III